MPLQTFSSEFEIMVLVISGILASGVNLGQSYLSGFLVVVGSIFFSLLVPSCKGLVAILLMISCIGADFASIVNFTNTFSDLNARTNHYKLFRTSLIVYVTICIFMCDFKSIWQERFNKTEDSGISLMDTGTIFFVFNTSFTKKGKDSRIFHPKIFFLVIMGLVRYFLVKKLDFYVSPAEYGFHLNFYFILAILNFCYALYKKFFHFIVFFDTTIGICILYQLEFLKTRLFSLSIPFLQQNKEGFSQFIGYFAMMLIVSDFSHIYRNIAIPAILSLVYLLITLCIYKYSTAKQSFILNGSFNFDHFVLTFFNNENPLIGRRFCNANYVLWALFISFFTFFVSLIFSYLHSHGLHKNYFVDFMSTNLMFIFLLGNFLIIIAKLFFYNLKIFGREEFNALLLNFVYLVLTLYLGPRIKQYLFPVKKTMKAKIQENRKNK